MALTILVVGLVCLVPAIFIPPIGGAVVVMAGALIVVIGTNFWANAGTIAVVAFLICPVASLLLPRPYLIQQFGLLLCSGLAAGAMGGATLSKPFAGFIGVVFALVAARIYGACTSGVWARQPSAD